MKEDIPQYANVLPGPLVLSIKSKEDGETKFKARYVVAGHRNSLKHMMVHTSQTVKPSSVRILPSLAAIYRFDVWTANATQAYLQAALPPRI